MKPKFYNGDGHFPNKFSNEELPSLTKEEAVGICHRVVIGHYPRWKKTLYELIKASKKQIPLIISENPPPFVLDICESILKQGEDNGKEK